MSRKRQPLQSSGQDSELPLLGAPVQSLVRELGSCLLCSVAKMREIMSRKNTDNMVNAYGASYPSNLGHLIEDFCVFVSSTRSEKTLKKTQSINFKMHSFSHFNISEKNNHHLW